jgi:hypothetical protein
MSVVSHWAGRPEGCISRCISQIALTTTYTSEDETERIVNSYTCCYGAYIDEPCECIGTMTTCPGCFNLFFD